MTTHLTFIKLHLHTSRKEWLPIRYRSWHSNNSPPVANMSLESHYWSTGELFYWNTRVSIWQFPIWLAATARPDNNDHEMATMESNPGNSPSGYLVKVSWKSKSPMWTKTRTEVQYSSVPLKHRAYVPTGQTGIFQRPTGTFRDVLHVRNINRTKVSSRLLPWKIKLPHYTIKQTRNMMPWYRPIDGDMWNSRTACLSDNGNTLMYLPSTPCHNRHSYISSTDNITHHTLTDELKTHVWV